MTFSQVRTLGWLKPFGTEYAYFRKWGWAASQVIRVVGLLDLASRLRWRMLVQQLGRRRFQRVLDAGCGTGVFAFQLVRTGRAERVDGIDVRHEVINEATRIARQQRESRVRFQLQNMSDWRLPWSQPPYDLIICVEALTYCRDPASALAGFCEALAPDGLLFLTLPHDERLDNPRHFSVGQAEQMLSESGFEVIEVTYTIGRYHAALTAVFDFLARYVRPLAPLALPVLLGLACLKRFPVARGQFVLAVARPTVRRCAAQSNY